MVYYCFFMCLCLFLDGSFLHVIMRFICYATVRHTCHLMYLLHNKRPHWNVFTHTHIFYFYESLKTHMRITYAKYALWEILFLYKLKSTWYICKLCLMGNETGMPPSIVSQFEVHAPQASVHWKWVEGWQNGYALEMHELALHCFNEVDIMVTDYPRIQDISLF